MSDQVECFIGNALNCLIFDEIKNFSSLYKPTIKFSSQPLNHI